MTKKSHDSETPAHGQQVISVCAFIHHDFDDGVKVFLPKRAKTKKFLPDKYELPGGHVDYGEQLVVALKREIKEELNMSIKVGDPFAAFTYENTIKGSHSVEVIYFTMFVEAIDQITIQTEDHSGYEWFTKEEVIQHKQDLTATEHAIYAEEEDPEYTTILKGFELLDHKPLKFS
ncbi:MAG TPA: NUDIX domain-containing protein [Candidatus Saccharimonadales bacterium]|nr:NUDIX domain-containing protein [Candidatus Saccharimonadales bacterium]